MSEKLLNHPIADIFPMMTDAEIVDLAQDIKKNGCHTPVVLFEDKVLDGRNRVAACEISGAHFVTNYYTEADPVGFVLSLNLHRRHLNESQRAMVAGKIADLPPGHPEKNSVNRPNKPEITQETAAEMLNVSTSSVGRARKVIKGATAKTKAAVVAGKLSVTKAAKSVPSKKAAAPTPLPTGSDEVDAALVRIGKICGKDVKLAIEDGRVAIGKSELLTWAGENDVMMVEVGRMVIGDRDWKPSKAIRFLKRSVDGDTRVRELHLLCIAADGRYEATIEGFDVLVLSPTWKRAHKK